MYRLLVNNQHDPDSDSGYQITVIVKCVFNNANIFLYKPGRPKHTFKCRGYGATAVIHNFTLILSLRDRPYTSESDVYIANMLNINIFNV